MGEKPELGALMGPWDSVLPGPFEDCGGHHCLGIYSPARFFHRLRAVPGRGRGDMKSRDFLASHSWACPYSSLCEKLSVAGNCPPRLQRDLEVSEGDMEQGTDYELWPHGVHSGDIDWMHTGARHCANVMRDTPFWL